MSPGGILPLVFHALWTAAATLTGVAGLTPIDAGLGLAGILLIAILVGIIQAVRNKTSFSLNPKDSEWRAPSSS